MPTRSVGFISCIHLDRKEEASPKKRQTKLLSQQGRPSLPFFVLLLSKKYYQVLIKVHPHSSLLQSHLYLGLFAFVTTKPLLTGLWWAPNITTILKGFEGELFRMDVRNLTGYSARLHPPDCSFMFDSPPGFKILVNIFYRISLALLFVCFFVILTFRAVCKTKRHLLQDVCRWVIISIINNTFQTTSR